MVDIISAGISPSAIGGRIAYDNRVADSTATLAASSEEDTAHAAENVADWITHSRWRPAFAVAAHTITVSWSSSVTVSCWAAAGHNWATLGATVRTEYQQPGSATWTEWTPETTVSEDATIYRHEGDNSLSMVAFRLTVTVAAGTVAPELGVLFVGPELVLPRGFDRGFTPPRDTLVPEFLQQANRYGQPIGATFVAEVGEVDIELPEVAAAWVRANWRPLLLALLSQRQFLFLWHPTVGTQEAVYCYDPAPTPASYANYTMQDIGLTAKCLRG